MGANGPRRVAEASDLNGRRVREAFRKQARACDGLGSPFTAWLCRELGARLRSDTAIGARVLSWPGDPSSRADSVPLRVCGALHALALSGRREGLSAAYVNPAPDPALWSEIEAALKADAPFLLAMLDSPPQTNEVARSAIVYPAFCLAAEQSALPVELLEVGASAGLNLNCDLFRYRIGSWEGGDGASPLRLAPESRGETSSVAEPTILARGGCDLRPVALTEAAAERRLLAYIWPDQPERLARMRAAIAIARDRPPRVERADAVEWLAVRLSTPRERRLRIVYSTVAWQYLDEEARARGEELIVAAGQRARQEAPLAWIRFESDGGTPGAALTLDWWDGRGRRSVALGRGDFHGRWIDWRPTGS